MALKGTIEREKRHQFSGFCCHILPTAAKNARIEIWPIDGGHQCETRRSPTIGVGPQPTSIRTESLQTSYIPARG
jgi:hypothetical protein